MALTPTLPAQRARDAIVTRLTNTANGFNAQLAACVPSTGTVQPFQIDFSDESVDFLHGKYATQQIIDDDELDFPLIALYQGPSRASQNPNEYLVGVTFYGSLGFGLDVHLMSAEGQTQSSFDRMVSCVHDAVTNAMNFNLGLGDFASRGLLWGQEITMAQPTRDYEPNMGRYVTALQFMLTVTSTY